MDSRRRWPRTVQHGFVSLNVAGSTQRLTATVEDVSAGGMRLALRNPLACGEKIVIRSMRGNRDATVRRCEQRKQDPPFVIGVEFERVAAAGVP